jgi:ribosomal protein S7
MNREVGVSEVTTVRKLLWKYLRKGDLESVSKIFEGAFAKISDQSRSETCQL